jgi:hypothetical protein
MLRTNSDLILGNAYCDMVLLVVSKLLNDDVQLLT